MTMKKSFEHKIAFIIAGLFLLTHSAFAQSKSSILVGDWYLSKWEYLKTNTNKELRIEKEAKDKIVSFKKDNRFETTQMVDGKKEIIGAGTYEISEDGKYFIQNNQSFKIVSFEENKFSVWVDADLIVHFKRLTENK